MAVLPPVEGGDRYAWKAAENAVDEAANRFADGLAPFFGGDEKARLTAGLIVSELVKLIEAKISAEAEYMALCKK